MKKFILALAATAAISGAAFATDLKPEDYRRTLFAPVGQDMLILEAPKGMCFMDGSKYTEGSVVRLMSDLERKKGNGVLLGAFASCSDVANFGNGANVESIVSSGTIVWLNPSIGEKTPMEKADYLDMREPTWKEDVQKQIGQMHQMEDKIKDMKDGNIGLVIGPGTLDDYNFDATARRTQDGVSIGYTRVLDTDFEKTETVTVTATTSLRHYPVEITLQFNAKDGDHDLASTHALMDKLLAQQSALND